MLRKATLWKWFYTQWSQSVVEPLPGYTILLMVPGDLPVFLKIALEICASQNPKHLIETLVIPDKWIPGFDELLENWARDYSISPLRLVRLKPLEYAITHYQNNPHTNCWLQMLRGVEAVRTTHALWHDADLFICEPRFLKTHYETCAAQQLACLGVSPVWDTWYRQQGINHLTATWELIFDVNWLRSFKPWEHRGHDGIVAGKPHTFDITFWPQCQTRSDQIGYYYKEWGFIHFNYVVGTYRWFQKSKGAFEDGNFRLLLVRLLIDAYNPAGWSYEVPLIEELAKGLTDSCSRVTYLKQETRQQYPEFRTKLQRLIDSNLLNAQRVSVLSDGVKPFDRAFGYREPKKDESWAIWQRCESA